VKFHKLLVRYRVHRLLVHNHRQTDTWRACIQSAFNG